MPIPAEVKMNLEADIRALNANFDQEDFQELFRKIFRLNYIVLAVEIESWLSNLQKQEKLPLINGLLAWYYMVIGDNNGAMEKALLAAKDFPDTDLWQTILETSSHMAHFENQK
jgi:hypothetical protein